MALRGSVTSRSQRCRRRPTRSWRTWCASPPPSTPAAGPASTELAPDLTALDFIWKLGEHVAAGGDPREFLFGRSI